MKQLGWLAFKIFMEKKGKQELLALLPANEKKQLSNLSSSGQNTQMDFDLKSSLLKWVHPSWLEPLFRSFSKRDLTFFLSALDPSSAEVLKKSLQCSPSSLKLSATAQCFFKDKMVQFLLSQASDLLPMSILPSSPLNELLNLSSKDLQLVVELLGLHDLAVEVKQIIDNVKLKQIYATLSKEKDAFLRILTYKKEPVVFKRLELSRWDGAAGSLLPLLFQRGMNRLAKALYPEDLNLIWYIKHRMSIEDSHIFSSLYRKLSHDKAYSLLSTQVIEAISFLKKIQPSRIS